MGGKRIEREEMYRLLLAALPGFAESWRRSAAEWTGDPRALPDYPPLGDISHHAVSEARHGRVIGLEDYRRVLGLLARRGDGFVRAAARGLAADLAAALER